MINERSNRVVDGGGGESVAKSHRCHCHLSLSLSLSLLEWSVGESVWNFMKRFFIWRGEWVWVGWWLRLICKTYIIYVIGKRACLLCLSLSLVRCHWQLCDVTPAILNNPPNTVSFCPLSLGYTCV